MIYSQFAKFTTYEIQRQSTDSDDKFPSRLWSRRSRAAAAIKRKGSETEKVLQVIIQTLK